MAWRSRLPSLGLATEAKPLLLERCLAAAGYPPAGIPPATSSGTGLQPDFLRFLAFPCDAGNRVRLRSLVRRGPVTEQGGAANIVRSAPARLDLPPGSYQSFGSNSPAGPRNAQSTVAENGVSSVLISITLAPACLAYGTRLAAG